MKPSFWPARRLNQGPDYRQALVALVGLLSGLSVFIGVERFIVPRYYWVTPVDQWIPFIAHSWWLYALFFPYVLLAAAYASAERFRAFGTATAMAFGVALVCFWLFPEIVPRPEVDLIDNAFLKQRISRLWQLDSASNGCPSLHVAVTCLACRALWDQHHKWLIAITGLLICVSTLTLKQHTVIDVAGGVMLAVVCTLLIQRQGGNARVRN
ncbi:MULTISPECIES: phosphatase PAP2 family protein [Pseudomonas syringae group]|uniref:PAP2 family protein n=1 Tax=Pseudomonas syringae pv. primulae TaxID=251707 RepID=A0A0P9XR67_9PSED|nr:MULTISPECIES: phosphatase PAP2 family protein [Pseudomonas syringae group]KPY38131.1 PAP2 family protein [Pseudomonas syringae pv. primulae]MBD8185495.1 inositol phosphorylceramide synthase [Pseudomonas viridiflava]MBD8202264.1 inositol phosphorylceramide synthase [Pseudomonas viridiflava]MDY0938077.1 phosphatase PAP2 family protein [Pseudomonas viridiflava]MDY1013902.1 phosphatase PAP2 family protein [Pseudomonas viridiflava]